MQQGGAITPGRSPGPAAAGAAVSAARRARPPSLSVSGARPGPAPLGPAGPAARPDPHAPPPPLPRLPRSRGRRARRAPGTPSRPRSPAASAACSAGPRAVTHRVTALAGPEVASPTATHPQGVTHSHTGTHTGSHTASQTRSTAPHSHSITPYGRVTQSQTFKLRRSHTLIWGPTLAQCPTASHIVTHSNSAVTTHAVSHKHANVIDCRTLPWGHKQS